MVGVRCALMTVQSLVPIIVLLTSVFTASTTRAQEQTLHATAVIEIRDFDPTYTECESWVTVGDQQGGDQAVLLRWDIAGNIPHRAEINEVFLTLYKSTSTPSSYTVEIKRITEEWPDCGVTWTTRPNSATFDGTPLQFTIPSGVRDTTAEVPSGLRNWVQSVVNGEEDDFGIMFLPTLTITGAAEFRGRGAVSTPPRLTIRYNNPDPADLSPSIPDLGDLTWGDSIDIPVTVQNSGVVTSDATTVTVRITDSGTSSQGIIEDLGTFDVPELEEDESITIDVPWTLPPGGYTGFGNILYACAKVNIDDDDNGNNTFCRQEIIGQPGPDTGDLQTTLEGLSGGTQPVDSGVTFVVSDGTSTVSNTGSNPYTFADLEVGNYSVDGRYDGNTPLGPELWRSQEDVSVTDNSTTNVTLQRAYPFASGVQITNLDTGLPVNPGEDVPAGANLQACITLVDPLNSAAVSAVQFVIDADRGGGGFDFSDTSTLMPFSNGEQEQCIEFTAPTTNGDYEYTLAVRTDIPGARLGVETTDSYAWNEGFRVVTPVCDPVIINAGNVNGIDIDNDGFSSQRTITWDTQIDCGSRDVFAEIRVRTGAGLLATETPSYTVSAGTPLLQEFDLNVTAHVLPTLQRGAYDLEIQLYDAVTGMSIGIPFGPNNDTDLANIMLEPGSDILDADDLLANGQWTIIIHGLSSASYGDINNVLAGDDPCDPNWYYRLAKRIQLASSLDGRLATSNVVIHGHDANRGEIVPPPPTDPDPNNDPHHHVLLVDWTEVSNLCDGGLCDLVTFFGLEMPPPGASGDDGYAEATADALWALLTKYQLNMRVGSVIGYSRGAVVATELTQRLIIDPDSEPPAQVVFLDAEGGVFFRDSGGIELYADNEFFAWSGIRTDNYYQGIFDVFVGGLEVPGARNYDTDISRFPFAADPNYGHGQFHEYFISGGDISTCGFPSPAGGAIDTTGTAGVYVRQGRLVTTHTPSLPTGNSSDPFVRDAPGELEIHNGDFRWGPDLPSTAGWWYHGGSPVDGDPTQLGEVERSGILRSGPLELVLNLRSGQYRTHNWLVKPDAAQSVEFFADTRGNDAPLTLAVEWSTDPTGPPESVFIDLGTDYFGPVRVDTDAFAGDVGLLTFRVTEAQGSDSIDIDDVAWSDVDVNPQFVSIRLVDDQIDVIAGQEVRATVQIARVNFPDPVTLLVADGCPSLAGCVFESPNPTSGPSLDLVIDTDLGTMPGSYTITIDGSTGTPGVDPEPISLTLNVIEPASCDLEASSLTIDDSGPFQAGGSLPVTTQVCELAGGDCGGTHTLTFEIEDSSQSLGTIEDDNPAGFGCFEQTTNFTLPVDLEDGEYTLVMTLASTSDSTSSNNTRTATFTISNPPPPCDLAANSVGIQGSGPFTAGESVTLLGSVCEVNGGSCSDPYTAEFEIVGTGPSLGSVQRAAPSLRGCDDPTLDTTLPVGLADGDYMLRMTITSSSDTSTDNNSATVEFTIDNPEPADLEAVAVEPRSPLAVYAPGDEISVDTVVANMGELSSGSYNASVVLQPGGFELCSTPRSSITGGGTDSFSASCTVDQSVPPGMYSLELTVSPGGADTSNDTVSSMEFVTIGVASDCEPLVVGAIDTPGSALGVTVFSDLAFVADDTAGLRVIDVSDPALPTELGFLDTPGFAQSVAVLNSELFVADGPGGVRVIDVQDPVSPAEIAAIPTLDRSRDVLINGSTLYIADNSAGVHAYDISTPANPTPLAATFTFDRAYGLAMTGTVLYVADRSQGIQVIDASDPAVALPIVLTIDTPGSALGLAVSVDKLLVADGVGGLQVYDISIPTAPVLLGSTPTLGSAFRVTSAGGQAIVSDSNGGLLIVDLTDPANPQLVASVPTAASTREVFVVDGRAFIADSAVGLTVADLFNCGVDDGCGTRLGSLPLPGRALQATLVGDTLFVNSDSQGLHAVNVTDPNAPTLSGWVDTAGFSQEFAFEAAVAYVADGPEGLVAIDAAAPSFLSVIDVFATPDRARDVEIDGNTAFVVVNRSGLLAVDVTNPANLVQIGSIAFPERAWALELTGHFALVANRSAGLRVIDVSDPASMSEASLIDTPGECLDVASIDDFAYIADGASGLQVIDISVPTSPALVRTIPIDGGAARVRDRDEVLVVSSGTGRVTLLDARVPSMPIILDSVTTRGSALGADFLAGYSFIADDSGGVTTIEWRECLGLNCRADLTGSSDPTDPSFGQPNGVADADDFFFYLDAFVASRFEVCDLTGQSDPNDPTFDVPDGDCDADDFFRYLDLFVIGCP